MIYSHAHPKSADTATIKLHKENSLSLIKGVLFGTIEVHDINKRPRLEVLVKELEKLDKYVPCAGKGDRVQIMFFGRIKMSKRKYMVRANRPALLRTARE